MEKRGNRERVRRGNGSKPHENGINIAHSHMGRIKENALDAESSSGEISNGRPLPTEREQFKRRRGRKSGSTSDTFQIRGRRFSPVFWAWPPFSTPIIHSVQCYHNKCIRPFKLGRCPSTQPDTTSSTIYNLQQITLDFIRLWHF
jgi:hypothetical protein